MVAGLSSQFTEEGKRKKKEGDNGDLFAATVSDVVLPPASILGEKKKGEEKPPLARPTNYRLRRSFSLVQGKEKGKAPSKVLRKERGKEVRAPRPGGLSAAHAKKKEERKGEKGGTEGVSFESRARALVYRKKEGKKDKRRCLAHGSQTLSRPARRRQIVEERKKKRSRGSVFGGLRKRRTFTSKKQKKKKEKKKIAKS